MKKLTCLLLFVSFFGFSQKDKKGNVFLNTADAAKMIIAKQKLYGGNINGALTSFREIEKNSPKDASVLYYIALCNFNLKQYDSAKESLLKALEGSSGSVKPETHLLMGKIYHLEENYDKAIDEFNRFKSAASSDVESNEDADVYLTQCNVAKTLLGNPVQVEITNMGSEINSRFDDKNPCVTADGTKLVFTTRRPEGADAPLDVEGDGKYFENVYMATLDSTSKLFTKALPVSGSINTKAHDACTSISPDGKQIFIYKNDMNDKASYGGNVFVSKLNNTGKWKAPVPLGKPIASEYWEGGVCVSPDGKKYFFTSERKGGFGGSDIWMVEKKNKTEWGKPSNLGADVNTSFDEAGIFLAPDGKTLFFCSNGPKSMGSYDILKTVFENGKWSSPVNVGYPINSTAKEGQLTLSADAKFAYISSERKGGLGENDIYKIDLKEYYILEKDGIRKTSNGLSILKGTIREGFEGYGMQDVDVTLSDENNVQIAATTTNENGEYFFTLHGGNFSLHIKKKGFTEITEKIELPLSTKETITLEKGYLLKK
jgi:hypothetical protein